MILVVVVVVVVLTRVLLCQSNERHYVRDRRLSTMCIHTCMRAPQRVEDDVGWSRRRNLHTMQAIHSLLLLLPVVVVVSWTEEWTEGRVYMGMYGCVHPPPPRNMNDTTFYYVSQKKKTSSSSSTSWLTSKMMMMMMLATTVKETIIHSSQSEVSSGTTAWRVITEVHTK